MSQKDADRWNSRYRDTPIPETINPPEVVSLELDRTEPGSNVLDIACGFGDAGLAFAQGECNVTLIDVSEVALDAVSQRAAAASLDITTVVADLDGRTFPPGPWDLIICVHYLDRAILGSLGALLAPGGRVVVAIATETNLDRHVRPSKRFLVAPGELPTLVPDLEVIHHDEAWRANGVHEAWLIATPR